MNKTVNIGGVVGNVLVGNSPEYQVNSAINELLMGLANQPFQFQPAVRRPPARTVAKIQHNQIQSKQSIIKQYMDHSAAVEAAYKGIDSIIPFGSQIILQNLNDLYFSALDYVGIDYLCKDIDIVLVREHAIQILEFIIVKLRNSSFESKNTPEIKELIEQGINVVVAHAFIECIIFENPEYVT